VRLRRPLLIATAILVVALLAGATTGPAGLTAAAVLRDLVDALPGISAESGLTATQHAVLWEIRLPRVVLGAMVGASLALAGAAYQGVFRNPLADPYLLGVSSGAGLGATLALVAGGSLGPLSVSLIAFVGGLAGVAATYALGSSVGGGRSAVVIILAGVAVAAFANAAQTYVQQRYDDSLRLVYAWLLGRLSVDGWSDVVAILPLVALAALVIFLHRRILDVLAVGEFEAATLGVTPERTRLILVVAATLGTASVVSVSGLIGFVGILIPHTVRLIFGASYRVLVPVSAVLGAAFLVLTDVLARTLIAPAEVPIGVVTAVVGAPFFLVVLRRARMVA
jgi:iron complex transport system permease protein